MKKRKQTPPAKTAVEVAVLGLPTTLYYSAADERITVGHQVTVEVSTRETTGWVVAQKTLEEAVTICCERGWQSLKADWLIDRSAAGRAHQTHTKPNRHSGFDLLDYTTGVNQDGSFV